MTKLSLRLPLLLLILLLSLAKTEGFFLQPRSELHFGSLPLNTLHPSPTPTYLSVVGEKSAAPACDKSEDEPIFFIRHCLPAEIGGAADVLTEAFFKENTNFFTYQCERLATFLSLQGGIPKPGERSALFVACHAKDGTVLGLAHIDDRPAPRDPNATPRPYMFNVAVDSKWQRKGIASALVSSCEAVARKWGKTHVYLKVRDNSEAAIALYEHLGYEKLESRVEFLNKKYQSLIIMTKYVYVDDEENYTDTEDEKRITMF